MLHNLSGSGLPVSEEQGLELSIPPPLSPERSGIPLERPVPCPRPLSALSTPGSAVPGEAAYTGGDLLCGTSHPSPRQHLAHHMVALHVSPGGPKGGSGEVSFLQEGRRGGNGPGALTHGAGP